MPQMSIKSHIRQTLCMKNTDDIYCGETLAYRERVIIVRQIEDIMKISKYTVRRIKNEFETMGILDR